MVICLTLVISELEKRKTGNALRKYSLRNLSTIWQTFHFVLLLFNRLQRETTQYVQGTV